MCAINALVGYGTAALEMNFYMRNQFLRDADWAGMAHSLEIRVPLVDTELLMALSPRIGAPEPFSKDAMVESVRSDLPATLLNRAKNGFSVPVSRWMGGGEPGRFDHPEWARRVFAAEQVNGGLLYAQTEA